jgi:predicted  nucleic acid-binding Zn-ribbon protein
MKSKKIRKILILIWVFYLTNCFPKNYNEKFKIEMENTREELNNLLLLQEKDSKIFNMEKRISEIPEEIKNLKKEIEDAQNKIKENEEKIIEMEKRLKNYFYEIEDIENLIVKFEQDKLKVRTNEEYRAIEKEISEAKKKKEKMEDEALNLMENIEEEKKRFEEFKRESKEKIEKLRNRIKEIEEEEKKLKDEIPIIKDERFRVSKRISEFFLQSYEKIKRLRGIPAVVRLRIKKNSTEGICEGCNASLPTQKVDKLKKTKGIDFCENCGRILYISEEDL